MTEARLTLIVVGVFFTIIGAATILLRVLTTCIRHRPTGKDDWSIFIAWAASIGFTVASFVSIRWGVGLRLADVPPDWEPRAIKAVFFIEIFYYLTLYFIKMSILFLYLRLAADTRNTFWRGTVATMVIIVLQFATTLVVVGTQCNPAQRYWHPNHPGHCINITAFFYSTNVFTILTDCVILALPIHTLWSVHLPRAQRIGIIGAFLVGGVSTIASCVRLYSVRIYTESTDSLRDAAPINTWSFIEINLAILCASVPAIKPLFLPQTAQQRTKQGSLRAHSSASGSTQSATKVAESSPTHSACRLEATLATPLTAHSVPTV